MDKYKIVKTEDGKWLVLTRDYFWQKWHPYLDADGNPVVRGTIEDALAAIKDCDVLLKGPTTTPMGGTMESANVTLRRELDLYANVRPVSIPEEGIDWIFYRENTEGEYVLGSRGVELPGLAMDFKVTTDSGTERIARAAFEYAKNNGKTRVSIVTKANIMKKTDGKFARIAREIAASEYPTLTVEDWYIDIMTAKLVDTRGRSDFQVFLLPNLYGDISAGSAYRALSKDPKGYEFLQCHLIRNFKNQPLIEDHLRYTVTPMINI